MSKKWNYHIILDCGYSRSYRLPSKNFIIGDGISPSGWSQEFHRPAKQYRLLSLLLVPVAIQMKMPPPPVGFYIFILIPHLMNCLDNQEWPCWRMCQAFSFGPPPSSHIMTRRLFIDFERLAQPCSFLASSFYLESSFYLPCASGLLPLLTFLLSLCPAS